MTGIETIDDDLFLPESPRWRDGRLWLADILGRSVCSYDPDWRKRTFAVFDDDPSGLGWDADGNLLAVGMRKREVLRVTDDGFEVVADLRAHEPFMINDMAVAADGTAFVTGFGSNLFAGEPLVTVRVFRVRPDGVVERVGPDVAAPNGIVLAPDDATLYVAEAGAARIRRIDDPLGAASDAGVYADLPDPDGQVLFIAVAKHTDLFAPRVKPGGRLDRLALASPA